MIISLIPALVVQVLKLCSESMPYRVLFDTIIFGLVDIRNNIGDKRQNRLAASIIWSRSSFV